MQMMKIKIIKIILILTIRKAPMKNINQKIIQTKRKKTRKTIISKKVIKQHQLKKFNKMMMKINNKVLIIMCKMNKKS
jgi:hypothetical protein